MSRRGGFAIGASIVSFVFVATVAATPGSPFSPALPAAARPSGPFRWLSGVVGVDAVHGNAFAALGVVAVALAAAAFVFVLYETWRSEIPPRHVLWLAVAYHVALLFIPLLFSRDVYSYAYYGRIAAVYHTNPYVATPADYPQDALAAFVGPKWFDTPAVYGPLWTQASALVARAVDEVAQFIAVFRVIAIAASLAVIAVVPLLLSVLVAVARAPAHERWRVLAAHGGVALAIALLAAAPFLNTTDPTLGVFELATHEGWLAPSRLFHRLFDAVGGEALELIPRIVFPLVFVAAIVAIGRPLVCGVMETARIGAGRGRGLP